MSQFKCVQASARECLAVVLGFISLSSCSSAPSKTVESTSGSPNEKVGTAKNSAAADIDLNCVLKQIQNPPDSFHYSFRAESDNPWEEEADVSPQWIDG